MTVVMGGEKVKMLHFRHFDVFLGDILRLWLKIILIGCVHFYAK